MQKIIDLNSVEICLIKPDEDDISKLDCRENDGNDPLGVQDYLANKALDYLEGKVSAIYVVKQNERILAFFTLSMTGLEYYRRGGKMINCPITPRKDTLQFVWDIWGWIKILRDRD